MLSRVCSLSLTILLVTGFSLSWTLKPAHAYIDLATGSYYIQMLIAMGFGGLFAIKVFWRRIFAQLARLVAIVKGSKQEPE